jgi:hypothetical protein
MTQHRLSQPEAGVSNFLDRHTRQLPVSIRRASAREWLWLVGYQVVR